MRAGAITTLVVATIVSLLFVGGLARVVNAAPPEIDVSINPDGRLAAGDTIYVSVSVQDPSTITSVTADGVSLTKTSTCCWTGSISASVSLGYHPVQFEVRDNLGNVVQDASTGYTTAPVVALTTRALRDSIVDAAGGRWLFVVSGRATDYNGWDAYLDDGSGYPVLIASAAAYGIGDGDFVRVRGVLSRPGGNPILEVQAADVLSSSAPAFPNSPLGFGCGTTSLD